MSKATILLIDDEAQMLTLLADILEVRGYSVIATDNGVDGYNLAKSKRPDIIILDIAMPDVDGGQVAQQLRETPQTEHIPIIFLTGLLSKEIEANNKHMVGGNVMFAKPCDFDELINQIEKLLSACAT
jgi:DNA-binding response OmpR family regulator